MLMLLQSHSHSHSHKALIYQKDVTLGKTSTFPTSRCYPLLLVQFHPSNSTSSFSLKCCATTSPSQSFTVSHLINNRVFSPETASKLSRNLLFDTSQNPDSVLTFFRNRGFSTSQIMHITTRVPWLLSCDLENHVLPKFEFLLSKGASASEVVHIVSKGPKFLARSLKNHLIPTYEFVRGFLQSDKQFIACVNRSPLFLSDGRVIVNSKLLLDNGVTHSNIARLLRAWPSILCSCDLIKTVEELKELGFDPSTSTFSVALLAKRTVSKTRWGEKVDTFKRWGWSEEAILEAFRRQPQCMLSSNDKIDAVMCFWVKELGFNSLDLVKAPILFLLSLQERVIPRGLVLQFLLSKGLRRKSASLMTPFVIPDKLFLEKFVERFEEESSYLLTLYKEKMDLANSKGKKNDSPSM